MMGRSSMTRFVMIVLCHLLYVLSWMVNPVSNVNLIVVLRVVQITT